MSQLPFSFDVPTEALTRTRSPRKKSKGKDKGKERGCHVCPANDTPRLKKIFGVIRGKDILVVAQSPGKEENREGRELIGPSGQWWWREAKRAGILRQDCDIQNVMRCLPADYDEETDELHMRNPSKEELRCCSVYTEQHLEKTRAKQVLVLGAVAAKQLFGRSLPKQKIFYSDVLKAKVYLLAHPSFFIRGYGQGGPLQQFRHTLKMVAADRKKQAVDLSDEYAYLRKQDFRLVVTEAEAVKAIATIRKLYSKRRLVLDIEGDTDEKGNRYLLGIGVCPKPGIHWFFTVSHRNQLPAHGKAVLSVVRELLQDASIAKVAHYGCSDLDWLAESGIHVTNFVSDTYLSEYLRFSDRKQYGLDAIAESRFPQMSGYKTIIASEMLEGVPDLPDSVVNGTNAVKAKYIEAEGKKVDGKRLFHLSKLSLDTLRLYNGGDCHLTKLIDNSNRDHVPENLLRLYIDLSFILYRMEPNGPLLDFEQVETLNIVLPARAEKLLARLRKRLKDPEFNPGSPPQVFSVLYDKLGLEYPFPGKPNTAAPTLLMLGREHKVPLMIRDWRVASKAKGITDGYSRSARYWNGKLRTKWWGDGARTGRLRSSGGGDKTKVNLQNVPAKDVHKANLLVSDTRWREAQAAIVELVEQQGEWVRYRTACEAAYEAKEKPPSIGPKAQRQHTAVSTLIEQWVQKEMPDLCTYLVADYGQVEVRVAAQMSGDKNLMHDCQQSDIHTVVGVAMTGWDAEKIKHDKLTRTLTKNCVAKGQRVLTDRGLVPIEEVTKCMLVWDGVEFVTHDGVVCSGKQRVITYSGLTTTPDHKVWLVDGRKVSLGYAQENGLELAVTGIENCGIVRYTKDCLEDYTVESFDSSEGERSVQETEVYDILNAGPRHRFTVEGKLVSNCHFGILFGISRDNLFNFVQAMSPPDMRDRISRDMVSEAYDRYFRRYKGIARFIEKQREFAFEHRYVETMFGMKQHLYIHDDNGGEEEGGEEYGDGRGSYWGNQAINGPVQGSAHQLMECALVNMVRRPKRYSAIGLPVMEIHDSLAFHTPVLQLQTGRKLVKYLLEKESLATVASDFPSIDWKVPIVTDTEAGLRFGCKVEIDKSSTVGGFLIEWSRKCQLQEDELQAELLGVAA